MIIRGVFEVVMQMLNIVETPYQERRKEVKIGPTI